MSDNASQLPPGEADLQPKEGENSEETVDRDKVLTNLAVLMLPVISHTHVETVQHFYCPTHLDILNVIMLSVRPPSLITSILLN